MFRSRGENVRSTYILLFLNVAFFLLQYQDGEKFVRLFAFDRDAVLTGQVWRIFTYQFMQAGQVGLIPIPSVVTLFLNLVLLTLMGMAIEEEWGTSHFLRLYLWSTLTTAAVAGFLGVPLMGSFFINFTLLFVYASLYRDQVFYLLILPIRVTFLALLAAAGLVVGVFLGSRANLAAFAGAAVGFAYYLSQRVRVPAVAPRGFAPAASPEDDLMIKSTKNITRVVAAKKALAIAAHADIDRLIELSEREVVRGVNICPPVDYKPDHSDRYCIRCEGFAECTARYLRLNRPRPAEPPAAAAEIPNLS